MNYKVVVEMKKEEIDHYIFEVTINLGVDYMIKTIQVDKSYRLELVGEDVSARALVQESIMFLLEREKPQEILQQFNLKDINKYFKDYESYIKERYSGV